MGERGRRGDETEERKNGEKLCRSNTITGKPEVFIVAHKGKNPSWPEANQLAHSLTSVSQGVELGTTEHKSSQRLERGLNSESPNHNSSALTALLCCL